MAVIEASEAGGEFTATTAWVGGKAPGSGDDIVFGEKSGNVTATAGIGVKSVTSASTYKGTFKLPSGSTNKLFGANAAGYAWQWRGGSLLIGTSSTLIEVIEVGGKFLTGGQTMGIISGNLTAGQTVTFEDAITAGTLEAVKGNVIVSPGLTLSLENGIKTSGASAKSLTLEGVTIKITSTGTIINVTGALLTLKATTATIELVDNSATTKTLKLGEQAWGVILICATGGAKLKFEETFSCVRLGWINALNGSTKKLVFKEGITVTVTELDMRKGLLIGGIIESSVAGKPFTIKSAVAGTVFQTEQLSIKDSHATNGEFYVVSGGTNVSGNEGWKFEAVPHIHTFSVAQAQAVSRSETLTRTLAAAQPQALALVRRAERSLVVAQAQATQRVATPAVRVAVSQAQVVSSVRAPSRVLAVTQAQLVARSGTLTRTLSLSQGQSPRCLGALSRTVSTTQAQAISEQAVALRTLSLSQGQAVARRVDLARALSAPGNQDCTRTASIARSFAATGTDATVAAVHSTLTSSLAQTTTVTAQRMLIREARISQSTNLSIHRSVDLVLRASAGQAAFAIRTIHPVAVRLAQGQAVSCRVSMSRATSVAQPVTTTVTRSPSRSLLASGAQSTTMQVAASEHLLPPASLVSSRASSTLKASLSVSGFVGEAEEAGRMSSDVGLEQFT